MNFTLRAEREKYLNNECYNMFFTFIFSFHDGDDHHLWGFGFGSGFGPGSRVGSSDAKLHEFIATEISRVILEETHVMFGTIKEGIIELMDECMRSLRVELVVSQFGHTLSFSEIFVLVRLLSSSGRRTPFPTCTGVHILSVPFTLASTLRGRRPYLLHVCWDMEFAIGKRRRVVVWEPRPMRLWI